MTRSRLTRREWLKVVSGAAVFATGGRRGAPAAGQGAEVMIPGP